ncbi:MAG: hypothetical protein EZS28_033282, partial [Streblomastix strix]
SKTQAKQTIVSQQDYDFDLRFIDILSFIPPNNTFNFLFSRNLNQMIDWVSHTGNMLDIIVLQILPSVFRID